MRYNKRRTYFKNIYKTDLCNCLKRNAKEHTYTVDGLINGGGLYPGWLISAINYSLANGWVYTRSYPGGLKTRGEGLKSGIYGMQEINRGVSQFRS